MGELVAIRRVSGKRSLIRAEDYDPATMTLWDAPQQLEDDEAPETMPVGNEATLGQRRRRGKARAR